MGSYCNCFCYSFFVQLTSGISDCFFKSDLFPDCCRDNVNCLYSLSFLQSSLSPSIFFNFGRCYCLFSCSSCFYSFWSKSLSEFLGNFQQDGRSYYSWPSSSVLFYFDLYLSRLSFLVEAFSDIID
jgi:hypothetical protein